MTIDLGEPLTGVHPVPGGAEARIWEHGVTITGTAGRVVVEFDLPMIGQPHIAIKRELRIGDGHAAGTPPVVARTGRTINIGRPPRPDPSAFDPGAAPLGERAITFEPGAWDVGTVHAAIRSIVADRLALRPTGGSGIPVPIELGAPRELLPNSPGRFGIPTTASLTHRQLYDVVVRADDGQWKVLAPHAIYYRESWHDFGIAHITDTHLARRIDGFRDRLIQRDRVPGAESLCNFNDRFRGFIRYANYLHDENELDVIVVTGDFIDYLFEDDDDPDGGGNALFARQLLLGQRPSATFPDVEELRVPIFVVAGNHDYRHNPYYLLFKVPSAFNKEFATFSSYNIGWWEALALSTTGTGPVRHVTNPLGIERVVADPDVPALKPETAAKMVDIDREMRSFKTHLANEGSYVVELGRHSIVMVDSAWDEGVVTSRVDAFLVWLGQGSEDQDAFVGNCPNSHGITDEQLGKVVYALRKAGPDDLVIVGMHAPLINPRDNAYAYYFRETQRPVLDGLVAQWLDIEDGPDRCAAQPSTRERHPRWWPTQGGAPAYLARGDNDDLLDWGVSKGRANDLLRILAGENGSPRKADLVLQGHTHRHNEFRIASDGGELAYLMDFYTQNPHAYYPTRFSTGERKPVLRGPRETKWTWESDVTAVRVADGAAPDGRPTRRRDGKYSVDIPPYPNPLVSSADPRTWWTDHRPLLLQTGALGPIENPDVSFSGFRVLTVVQNVIERVSFVPIQRLHEHGYRLSWEDARRVEPRAPQPVPSGGAVP